MPKMKYIIFKVLYPEYHTKYPTQGRAEFYLWLAQEYNFILTFLHFAVDDEYVTFFDIKAIADSLLKFDV